MEIPKFGLISLLVLVIYYNGIYSIDLEPRIVGGYDCNIEDHPYTVFIHHQKKTPFCSGSLLNKDWVLTAAHCVNLSDKTSVIPGQDKHSELLNPKNEIQVKNRIIHPEFVFQEKVPNMAVDIALLELEVSVPETPKTQYVQLPSKQYPADIENYCKTVSYAGWGLTKYEVGQTEGTQHLKCVEATTIDIAKCKAMFASLSAHPLHDSVMCTLDTPWKGACVMGDAGAAVICDKLQIAVVTSGAGCKDLKTPSVHTRVDHHLDFINQNAGAIANYFKIHYYVLVIIQLVVGVMLKKLFSIMYL